MKRVVLAFAVLATLAAASPARADDVAHQRAKESYDRGVDAHKHGEMARAAKEFAAADSYEPSTIALQAALDAAIEADDVALGAELLERSKRAPATPSLASSITAATIKFNARAGRIRIDCLKGATCSAKIDEKPVAVERDMWTPVGQHTVTIQVNGGQPQFKAVDINADVPVEVSPSKAGPLQTKATVTTGDASIPTTSTGDSSSSHERHGLSPWVFYAGLGITVVAAGVTTYFMVHASGTHGDFEDKGCDKAANAGCADLSDSGKSAQTGANVGLVVTVVGALATAAIGLAFTSWHDDSRHSQLRHPFQIVF